MVGTWNVEGLTHAKVVELQFCMRQFNLGVLCLHETHRIESTYDVTPEGFLLILSGTDAGETSTSAGVGFLVAPAF